MIWIGFEFETSHVVEYRIVALERYSCLAARMKGKRYLLI